MANATDIRLATPADADVVLSFITRMGFNPRTPATWWSLGMGAMTAWRDEALVGAIPFEPRLLQVSAERALNTVHQTCVAIDPALRGEGLGTRLQDALTEACPADAALLSVYREDPASPAYRWYRRCGFTPAMQIASYFLDAPAPEPRTPAYELMPHASGVSIPRDFLPGEVRRAFEPWLDIHPYANRYRFWWLKCEAGRVLLGVGKLHAETERADVLWHAGDAIALWRCAADACARRGWRPLRWPEARTQPRIGTLGLPDRWPFEMLIKPRSAGLVLDTQTWRYAGIDFA